MIEKQDNHPKIQKKIGLTLFSDLTVDIFTLFQ